MRSRFTRLAVLAIGVVGLLGSYTPPAQAHTVGVAVFVADVKVTGGIGYPITTLPTPSPNLLILPDNPGTPQRNETTEHLKAHAVGAQGVNCLTLPTNSILGILETQTGATWNCHWVFDHRRDVSFSTIDPGPPVGPVCFDVLVNIGKNKPPVHPPGCSFSGTGFVTGHCGLSGGQVTGTLRDGLGNRITFDIHFRGVGGLLVLSGHWRSINLTPPQHGKIYALAAAIPPTPTTPGQSCTDKTAEDFLVAGVAKWYSDPFLL